MPDSCNPTDCSPLDSSLPGISQTGILEWIVISFSKDLPNPGIECGYLALQVDSLPDEPVFIVIRLLKSLTGNVAFYDRWFLVYLTHHTHFNLSWIAYIRSTTWWIKHKIMQWIISEINSNSATHQAFLGDVFKVFVQ